MAALAVFADLLVVAAAFCWIRAGIAAWRLSRTRRQSAAAMAEAMGEWAREQTVDRVATLVFNELVRRSHQASVRN